MYTITERLKDQESQEVKTEESKMRRKERDSEVEVEVAAHLSGQLELLGMDMMLKILSFLDARSGVFSLLVCHSWNDVASSDRLWSSKCDELWLGKAHMPRFLQVHGQSRLAAFSLSVVDRKRAAPRYWQNLDPYWRGTSPLIRRYFHPDGSQTADHGDQVWGGHESCYSTVTSTFENGKIREHYVRLPEMYVSRKEDWSWEMSSHLCYYSSIPDSDKPGGTGPMFPLK